jgi:hypothetical protein
MEATFGGKWLELLSEIAPGLKRAAIMFKTAGRLPGRVRRRANRHLWHSQKARPEFQAIYDRYKPPTGKLHIADLLPDRQEALRQEVYAAIRKVNLPCFWYAIHVDG